jgi:peptidoglycan/LPS O-acetylase OafA/YrhL
LVGPQFNVNLIDPPIWSLIIEVKMSVILPLFIVIASRSKPALNIGLLVFLIWLAWQYEYDVWALAVFYWGVLIAKYKNAIVTGLTNRSALFMMIISMLAIFLYNNNYEFPGFIQKLQLPFKYSLSKYLMAAGSGILIMLALVGKRITQFLEHRFFAFFGDISYSFYLIHAPILLTMASLFSNKYLLSPVCIFLSSFLLAVALAYGMFIYIERPFQKIAKQLIAKYKILNSLGIN